MALRVNIKGFLVRRCPFCKQLPVVDITKSKELMRVVHRCPVKGNLVIAEWDLRKYVQMDLDNYWNKGRLPEDKFYRRSFDEECRKKDERSN